MKYASLPHLTLWALVSVILALGSVAHAEDAADARPIAIPGSGLTLDVPAGWALEQYGPAVLRVRKGQATLWFYAAENADEGSVRHLRRVAEQAAAEAPKEPAPEPKRWKVEGAPDAMQLWYAQEERARFHGIVPTKGGGFYAEADLPGDAPKLRSALEAMLASVDARPYVHPERHVDWTLGFTIDAASAAWRVKREDDGRIRIAPSEQPGVVVVEQQGKTVSGATPQARLEGLIEAMRRRLAKAGRPAEIALEGEPKEATLGEATPAVGAAVRITLGEAVAMRGHVYVVGRFAISAVAGADDEAAIAAVHALAKTFRTGTHPGSLVLPVVPTGRFEREDAPKVVFALPEGWVLTKPRTTMHAGHFKLSKDGKLEGAAYYFGAGAGGGLEANLLRWKGQMGDAEEPVQETLKIAEGIEATVLDIVGNYGSHARAPQGHPGGSETETTPGQRMLAAVMTCPRGPLYFKLVGPKDEVAAARPAFMAWLKSFRAAP